MTTEEEKIQRELEEEVNREVKMEKEERARWEAETCDGEPIESKLYRALLRLYEQERQRGRLIELVRLLLNHHYCAEDVHILCDWWESNKEAIAKMPGEK